MDNNIFPTPGEVVWMSEKMFKLNLPADIIILVDRVMNLKKNNFKGTLTISLKDGLIQGKCEERRIDDFNNVGGKK